MFSKAGKDEHDVIVITKEINDLTTLMKKSGNVEKILSYSINKTNLRDFSDYYRKFAAGTDYKVDYNFKKIVRSGASPFFGYVMFTAEYKVYIKDSLAYTGDQVQTFYFSKKAGKWKIFKSTLIDTRDKVYISNCPCNMKILEKDKYEVKLHTPHGNERQEYLYTFVFEEIGGGKSYVYMNGDKYLWEEQKIEMKNMNDEKLKKKAGKFLIAKDKNEVIKNILQFYNKSACLSINLFQ
jgi:uncharacterized protein YlzI (FlbEa/FlbD family)